MKQDGGNNLKIDDFFEEVDFSSSEHDHHETLTPDISDTGYSSGLSQENVYKLTEDLLNPLPPSDHDL